MTNPQNEVLQGTLDLLILRTLTLEPMHGWGIAQRIQQLSKGALDVNQGSLYPALHRMEQKGYVAADWATSQNNRKARFYRLTTAGRRAAGVETENWRRYVASVELVLAD